MAAFRVQGVLTVKLLSLVRPKAIGGNKMRKGIITKGSRWSLRQADTRPSSLALEGMKQRFFRHFAAE